ncbi:hypothetical protein, partial [Nocardia abscessus]|uniref:hypothetical protein n=1 Tax=Nocardia abscessus TaxID=120957 RepID=UPI0024556FEF
VRFFLPPLFTPKLKNPIVFGPRAGRAKIPPGRALSEMVVWFGGSGRSGSAAIITPMMPEMISI